MDNKSLELQVKASANEAQNSLQKLIGLFTKVEQGVEKTTTKVDGNGKQINQTLTSTYKKGNQVYSVLKKIDKNGQVKHVTSSIKTLNNQANSTQKILQKVNKALSFATVGYVASRLTNSFLEWMDLAVDRTEQLNLFNVVFKNIEKDGVKTFSTLGKQAIQFQNTMNEAFGTNMTETLKYQGLFQSMAENVGIDDATSALMSETMTKLTYDLASLYNKEETDVAEALRAGVYAGQTKPLRSYGIDVTQQSLQPILDELGIEDRSVKQMSQAEKELLRYIATLRQAEVAMGDYANTIESPANQMKVFRQQLIEAKVALTSLFIGGFSKILPYANALLMVVKEISKAIADIFGIELSDYNSGIASNGDAYDDLADSVDGATDKVKELKRQTLGFDQIHNINENKDNGGSGNTTGGIDQRLLDAISGYDNGMDKVRMKAAEIRDKIMEWLGFTKEVDSITGEVFFKLKDGPTRFKKILDAINKIKKIAEWIFDHIVELITTWLGIKAVTGLYNLYSGWSKLDGIIKGSTLFKWVQSGLSIAVAVSLGIVAGQAIYDFLLKDSPLGNGKTFAENWSETFSLAEYNKTLENNTMQKYASQLGQIQATKGKDSQEYQQLLTLLSEIYYSNYGAVGGGLKLDIIKEYADQYASLMSSYGNYYTDAGSFLGNMDATAISSYTEALKGLFTEITNGLPNISSYITVIEQSKVDYDNASTSLGVLVAQMAGMDYTDAVDQLSAVNTEINNMKVAMDTASQATFDATSKIIMNLREQGIVSDEEAIRMIENANKIRLAQEGYTEQYINELTKLNKQLRDGKIDEDEYAKKMLELNDTYNQTATTAQFFNTKLDVLQGSMKITGENWEDVTSNMEDANTSYNDSLKEINDIYEQNIDWLTRQMSQYEKGSREYELYAQLIKDSNKAMEESTAELDKSYAQYLMNIALSLMESGDIMTEEGQALANDVNEKLRMLGYDVDDVTKENLDEVLKQYEGFADDLDTETGDMRTRIEGLYDEFGKTSGDNFITNLLAEIRNSKTEVQKAMNKVTPEMEVEFKVKAEELQRKVTDAFAKIGILLPTKADGGVYSNGNWQNIQKYANGGMPSFGQMFIAREAGPELVGSLGNRTAVMNNDQIVASVSAGVYNAVVSAMSQIGSSAVELYAHVDEGIVIDRINQKTKQTGICPIEMPA